MANRTDKEMLEFCMAQFQNMAGSIKRLNSGNVAHNSQTIRMSAEAMAEIVEKHLNK
jgi:hypothetical protein